MSFYGLLILTAFIFIRLIPELTSLIMIFDPEYADRDRYSKVPVWPFVIAGSGINFAVYLLVHYRTFHSWNIAGTVLKIVKLEVPYQDWTYFTKSFLLCTAAGIGTGILLRCLRKHFFGTAYGQREFSVSGKAISLLSVSVTAAASVVCYGVKASGISRLMINEICSKNQGIFLDKDETVSDYVELYNSGSLPYLVSGIYLSDDAEQPEKYEVPRGILYPGEYQVVVLDENAPFQLSDSGETLCLSLEGQLLEQVGCAALSKDCSYSRLSDGGDAWGIRTCTPGEDNGTSYPVLSAPVFSREGGFYTDEFDLEIFCEEGETIFYTLDGSVPSAESNRYQGAIHISDASENENIWSMREDVSAGFLEDSPSDFESPDYLIDKCTVLRAVCIDGDGNQSPVASATFFVGFDRREGYQGMNILSIMTEPDNLFEYNKGIYVLGSTYDITRAYDAEQWYADLWWWQSANYRKRGRDWEREACLQFFDADGNLILTKDAGIRIQGDGSRWRLPRSLNLYARDEYDGNNRFEADFFGNGYEPQRMTLFAGSDDNLLKLKDYLAASVVADRGVSTMDFVPYVMFLDGEYWGCYWLIEKYDEEYFAYHYGVDSDNVLMVKDDDQEKIAVGNAEDEILYDDMYAFVTGTDFTKDENYRKICGLIDVDDYINYCAAEVYIANMDWPYNNYGFWRTRTAEEGSACSDGKWRCILFDVNDPGTMNPENAEFDLFGRTVANDPMFSNMMDNPEFARKFVSKILEMADREFLPENINAFIDDYRELMEEPLAKEYERFYGKSSGKQEEFEEELQNIRDFFERRYVYIKDYFENYEVRRQGF